MRAKVGSILAMLMAGRQSQTAVEIELTEQAIEDSNQDTQESINEQNEIE